MSRPFASHRIHVLSLFTLLLAVTLLLAPSAAAQLGAGQIEGAVTDSTGALVAGAKVTVRNENTGLAREFTTDARGRYRAVELAPGSYTVRAEHSGFARLERQSVSVTVGSTTTLNLPLTVTGVEEVIIVTEAASTVKTENTEVSSTVPNEIVNNVPVIGRRWDNYVLLTPGIATDGTFGLISYRGVSGLYNNNTVDGLDNNQAFFSEARGRTRVAYTYSQAAVKEFQVDLNNFSAESGRAAGGLVNAVTKSGGNDFHGEAFYFFRDDATNAHEPIVKNELADLGLTDFKLPERRQMYGFAMGGPARRDKLFWFLSYDEMHRTFPYVVGGEDTSRWTSTNCASLAPNTNQVATCEYLASLKEVVPRKALNNVALGKLDWIVNDQHNANFSYNFHLARSPNGIRTPLINDEAASDNGFDGVRTDNIYAKLNSVLSATLINQLRFQYARDNEFQRSNAPGPGFSLSGGINFGQPNFLPRPKYPFERRYQVVDNVTWMRGAHTLKFGGDVNYVQEELVNLFLGGGVYSYSSFSSLAGDCPPGAVAFGCVPDGSPSYSNYSQAFDRRVVDGELSPDLAGAASFSTTDWNFFVHDTWKARPDLTINLGLRYEYQRLPEVIKANPEFPLTSSLNQDTNNFGPRISAAWDMSGNQKLVLRGGYGLVYGRTQNSTLYSALAENGEVISSLRFFSNSAGRPVVPECFIPAVNSNCTLATPSLAGATSDVFMLEEDFQRPMVHQANVALETELFKDTVLSITWAYSGGRNLPVYVDTNLPDAGAEFFVNVPNNLVSFEGRTLFPAGTYGPFPFYCNGAVDTTTCSNSGRPNPLRGRVMVGQGLAQSSYHGLIVRVNRRMSRGLLIDGHYTWAKAIDNGQNSITFFNRSTTAFDPQNLDFDRSRGNFDVRHRVSFTYVWEPDAMFAMAGARKAVLGGWKFSGTTRAQTGAPVTPNLSGFLSSALRPIDGGSSNGVGGLFRAPFVARNAFNGPGFATFDLRVSRRFAVTESTSVEVGAESINLFNRANYTFVHNTGFDLVSGGANQFIAAAGASCGSVTLSAGDRCITAGARDTSSSTGFIQPRQASSTYSGPREFQFLFKFHW